MATSGVDAMISARGVEMKAGWGSSHDRRTKVKTRFKNGKKIRVIHKLDEEQIRWIVRQKANGQTGNAILGQTRGMAQINDLLD